VFLASCSTTEQTQLVRFPEIDGAVTEGRFEDALSRVEAARQTDEFSVYNAKNEISFLLDKGLLAHYAGDYAASAKDLEESERLIEEAFTKSISDNFSSTMLDDPYQEEYIGEDFENIYVNIFNALNYYHAGDIDNAAVEIRRLNEKLVYIKQQYETQDKSLLEKTKEWISNAVDETFYSQSALAQYLGALFWRGAGHPDDARIDAQGVAAAFAAAPAIYSNPLPPELVMRGDVCDELEIPGGMARLNALCFTGLSPYKTVANPNFLWHGVENFLAYDTRPNLQKLKLSLLEHMGKVMQEVYDTRETRRQQLEELGTVLKGFASGNMLGGIAIGIFEAATSRSIPDRPLNEGDEAVDAWVNDRLEAENTAHDLRMTRCLPGAAYTGGINLAPGRYSFTVNYYSGAKLSHSKRYENVAVEAGKLNLIEDYCFTYNESRPPVFLSDDEALPDFPGRLPAPKGFQVEVAISAKLDATRRDKKIKSSFPKDKPPEGLRLEDISFHWYKLSWDPVPGATRYCIYRLIPDGTAYMLWAIITEPKVSMTIEQDPTVTVSSNPAGWLKPAWPTGFKVLAVGPDGYGIPSGEVVK
jgi:hypothetical protein